MNIRIDTDLAIKATAIARNNGLSVASYVNGLLESALNGELARAKAQALDEKRRKVIDRLWENHEFPKGIKLEGFGGWESIGGDFLMDFTREFFYSHNDRIIKDASRKGIVNINFTGKSIKPSEVSFEDCDGNDL